MKALLEEMKLDVVFVRQLSQQRLQTDSADPDHQFIGGNHGDLRPNGGHRQGGTATAGRERLNRRLRQFRNARSSSAGFGDKVAANPEVHFRLRQRQ